MAGIENLRDPNQPAAVDVRLIKTRPALYDRGTIPTCALKLESLKTLKRRLISNITAKLGRFEQTFSQDYELLLVKHIQELDAQLMPLSRKEFLKLAFQLTEELKLPHRFNNNEMVELLLRTPGLTSMMKAIEFNKHQVSNFFEKLESLYSKDMFPPSQNYNVDETGISCVHENTKSERNQEEITPASASDLTTQCTDTDLGLSSTGTIGSQNLPSPVNRLLALQMRNAETQPSTNRSGFTEHHTPQMRNEEPRPSISRSKFSECGTLMKQKIRPRSIEFKLAMKKLSLVPDSGARKLSTRKWRTQISEILTSSPYKNSLEDKKNISKQTIKPRPAELRPNLDTNNSKNKRKYAKEAGNKNSKGYEKQCKEETTCILCAMISLMKPGFNTLTAAVGHIRHVRMLKNISFHNTAIIVKLNVTEFNCLLQRKET
ncbi:hypothetical protein C0J52_14315 [Blattella germanica]|nr:hypothetical protein C0J52_14315 [Blattella germanica]